MITQEIVKSLFDYSTETGDLIRKTSFNRWKSGQAIGFKNTSGYLEAGVNKKTYQVSHLVWCYFNGPVPIGREIDHINGKKLDNRIENLRVADRAMNNQNKRISRNDSALKVLGVSWHKASKSFVAQISKSGVKFHLGCFKSIDEASEAYIQAKRNLHQGCTI